MKAAPARLSPPGWSCHRRLLPSRQRSSAQPLSCLCSALGFASPTPSLLSALQGGVLAGESAEEKLKYSLSLRRSSACPFGFAASLPSRAQNI